MTAQVSVRRKEAASVKTKIYYVRPYVAVMVLVAILGPVISFVFLGVCHIILGHIPTFFGFSRFWLDPIAGSIFALIILWYLWKVDEGYYKLSGGRLWHVFFLEFVAEYPVLSLIGFLLAIDFVASIFFSLTAGLAAIVAGIAVVWICFNAWMILSYIVFAFCEGWAALLSCDDVNEDGQEEGTQR